MSSRAADAPGAPPGAPARGGSLRPGRSDPAGADFRPPPTRVYAHGATRRVLARLVEGRGAMVPVEALLLAAFGFRDGPADERGTLRVVLCRLRRQLPPGALRNHRGEGYSLDAAASAALPRARRDARRLVDVDMIGGGA